MSNAQETIRFTILNHFISTMPPASHPFLQKAAEEAAIALADPYTRWSLREYADHLDALCAEKPS